MNKQVNPSETALAMYATACETHQRRDWREACHALAKALRQELESSASMRAMLAAAPEAADPMPAPAKLASKPRAAARIAKGAPGYTMTAGSLAAALRLLAKVSPARSTQPILHTVLLEARGDVLAMTATDLDHEVTLDVTAPGVGEWRAAPILRDLRDMLAKADKGAAVTLAPYPSHLHSVRLTIGAAQSTLAGRDPADFPRLAPGVLHPLELDGAETVTALRFVQPAISDEPTRFYLNGVYFARPVISGAHRLHIVATDGHRLHRWEGEPMEGKPGALYGETAVPPLIIPRLTVASILAFAGDGAGLAMEGNANYVAATAGPARLVSKVIDGAFPDYMRVIPTRAAFTMTADRSELASKCAAVSAVCDSKARLVRMGLAHKAGELLLTSRNFEGGEAADSLKVKASAARWGKEHGKKGEPEPAAPAVIEWGINASYVRDALASMTGENVTVDSVCPASAFRVTDPADDRRLAVLMPIRV